MKEINASMVLADLGREKNVYVVGHFSFVRDLKPKVKNLWVLEKRPRLGDLPTEKAGEVIPKADILAITATALINDTMDFLLALRKPGTLTMVLGPTTPLTPLWFDLGVQLVSGTVVTDPELIMGFLPKGLSFRQFRGRGVRTVTLVTPGFTKAI